VKNIFLKSMIFLFSLIASWVLCYFVISEVIIRFMNSSIILNLIILFIIAFIFYISAISIINKKIDKSYINIIAVLYFIGIIGITFFKGSYPSSHINLNPLSVANELHDYFNHTLLLLISNTILYIPVGIYVNYKTNIKILNQFSGFLLYILLIEFIQFISHSGVFDINDILTNTIGYIIGALGTNLIRNYFNNCNINSSY